MIYEKDIEFEQLPVYREELSANYLSKITGNNGIFIQYNASELEALVYLYFTDARNILEVYRQTRNRLLLHR